MRLGWIGCHREGIAALRGLLERGVGLAGIVTLDAEQARKRSGSGRDAYRAVSREFGVPLYEVASINSRTGVAMMEKLGLDLVFVIGWSQILRPRVLQTLAVGAIGAHASLLPCNRGRAPINWALIKGDRQTGNTLMWLADEVDTGDIIDQRVIPISPYDTCESLYERVAESNREMILAALPGLLRGQRPGRPQPAGEGNLLPGRRPEDGLLDWGQESESIYNFVRALTRPYPGAFAYLAGQRWFIWRCALLPGNLTEDHGPGQIIGPVFSPDPAACGQQVACGRGSVVLLEAERAGGPLLQGYTLSQQPWEGEQWTREP